MLIKWLEQRIGFTAVAGVGHRVVHGGVHFTASQRITPRLIAELRRLGAHSFLLVTSEYHTRRAGNIFRKVTGDLDMRVIAAPDEYFSPDSWWRNREGQKIVYMEWSKTVASWFGI